jgi:hypothetical protein
MGAIYSAEQVFSPAELILWIKIVDSLSDLGRFADYTSNGLRIIIENQKN